MINREWGLAKNENPIQGSFIIEELTDLVEEAVLQEFAYRRTRRRAGRDGTGYQRGKIQEESMHYEHLKHDGTLPIGAMIFSASAQANDAGHQKFCTLLFVGVDSRWGWLFINGFPTSGAIVDAACGRC
jgi:hypothetical protein